MRVSHLEETSKSQLLVEKMERGMKLVQKIVVYAQSIHWTTIYGIQRHIVFAYLVIMEKIVNMVHCATIHKNAVAKVNVEFINSITAPLWRNVCVTMVILETFAQSIHAQASHVKIMEHVVV